MKQIVSELLAIGEKNFKVPVLTYETIAEAEADGGPGSVLKECNSNLLARGAFADARDMIVEATEYVTKVAPLTVEIEKEVEGKKVKATIRDPKETELKYVKRALAGAPDGSMEKIQEIVTALALGQKVFNDEGKLTDVPKADQKPLRVDIRVKTRTPKAVKLAEKWKLAARQFLAAPARLANFNKHLTAKNLGAFTPTGDAAADETALGWKCKAWADAQDPFASVKG